MFSPLVAIFSIFPGSVYAMKKLCRQSKDKFEKFVVCRRCHSIYKYDDCFETVRGREVPKNCPHIAFPNHPHNSRRKACDEKLLAEVTLSSGVKQYFPYKVYCYASLIDGISNLLQRKGSLEAMEYWRHRSAPPNGMLYLERFSIRR